MSRKRSSFQRATDALNNSVHRVAQAAAEYTTPTQKADASVAEEIELAIADILGEDENFRMVISRLESIHNVEFYVLPRVHDKNLTITSYTLATISASGDPVPVIEQKDAGSLFNVLFSLVIGRAEREETTAFENGLRKATTLINNPNAGQSYRSPHRTR